MTHPSEAASRRAAAEELVTAILRRAHKPEWAADLVATALARAVEGAKAEGYSIGYKEGLARAVAEWKAAAGAETPSGLATRIADLEANIRRRNRD